MDAGYKLYSGGIVHAEKFTWHSLGVESRLDQKGIFRPHSCHQGDVAHAKEKWEGPNGKFFILTSSSKSHLDSSSRMIKNAYFMN